MTDAAMRWLAYPAILEDQKLGLSAMAIMLALVCGLTAADRIAREHKGIAATAIAGWCVLAGIGLLRGSITGDPPATSAWAAAGVYLVAILATLGRPLLLASDLIEEEGGHHALTVGESRRSRVGQVALLAAIVGIAALFTF